MKKYAVIRLVGNQYIVSEGDEILVNKITGKVEPEVLLVADGEKVSVGKPNVSSAKLSVKVLNEEKGKKLHVSTYKAKSRSRKKVGFRPTYSRLQIQKIA